MRINGVTLTQADQGKQAEALLSSRALTEAFAYLEKAYIEAWKAGVDVAARERAWNALNALEVLKGHLEATIAKGRLARSDLDRISGRLT